MSSKDESIRLSKMIAKAKPVAASIITGAAFGSALTLSGLYSPSVITSQMQLRNFHMLQTFLTASAVSVVVVQTATKTGYCPSQAHTPSSLCNLPPYSSNIFGGILIGTSMAITGACPGTLLVQAGLGSISATQIGLGGLLGGIAFVKLAPFIYHTSTIAAENSEPPACGAEIASEKPLQHSTQYTIAAMLGVKTRNVALAYGAVCIAVIALAAKVAPNGPTAVNPILGGLAIGGAQALSILVSRKTIGVSAAYQQLAKDFWNVISPSSYASPSSRSAVWFAIGIIIGAKALTSQVPDLVPVTEMQKYGTLTSLIGGATMVFGAALAGGCTSGHGISGTATLSLPSFVTVAAIFGGGIVCKALIG